MARRALTAALVMLYLALSQPAAAADGLQQTLAEFDRACGQTARAFAKPIRIGEHDSGGNDISFDWGSDRYREEYRSLGFTEVFAYDGAQHWYGSDINLPYPLDGGGPPSITLELCRALAFLREPWRGYLSAAAAAELPAGPKLTGTRLKFTPPDMAEALLELRDGELRVFTGNRKRVTESNVITELRFRDWQPYAACSYPSQIETRTYAGGKLVRTRTNEIGAVESVGALPVSQFSPAGSPPVSAPALPKVPYTIDVEIGDDGVVIPCTAADGTPLRLVFDTGAQAGLLRRETAARLGLIPEGTLQLSGHGGTASVGQIRVEGVRIGAAQLPAWPASVLLTDNGLDRRLGLAGEDGLLGNFLLHFYVVQVDYPHARLTLWPRDNFNAAQLSGAFAAPLHRAALPWTEVVVDGKIRGGAYFNTGAEYTFALSSWACDDAHVSYPVESMGRGVTVGGSALFGLVRPGEVQLASEPSTLVIKSPLTMLELQAPGEATSRWRIASFGAGFLKDYTVTFDLGHGRVYLQ